TNAFGCFGKRDVLRVSLRRSAYAEALWSECDQVTRELLHLGAGDARYGERQRRRLAGGGDQVRVVEAACELDEQTDLAFCFPSKIDGPPAGLVWIGMVGIDGSRGETFRCLPAYLTDFVIGGDVERQLKDARTLDGVQRQ